MWWAVLLLVFVLPEIVAFTRPATRTVAPSGAGRVDRAVVSMYCGVCGGKTVDTSAHAWQRRLFARRRRSQGRRAGGGWRPVEEGFKEAEGGVLHVLPCRLHLLPRRLSVPALIRGPVATGGEDSH